MRDMELLRQAPSGNTVDPQTGNEIRRTDNGPREGERAPQHARPLTGAEVAAIAGGGGCDGDA